jgi:hypothetical protein
MTRKRMLVLGALCGPLTVAAVTVWIRGGESLHPYAEAHRPAATYPDYSDAVIPPNVAPLNLKVLESGRRFCLRLSGAAGAPIQVFSSGGSMQIPPDTWRSLLKANAGGELKMDIYVKGAAGWTHFDTVRNPVAADEIDPYVVYRYIPPIYDKWDRISLRQRDLRSFEERILLDNERSTDPSGKTAGNTCINCHTFLNHRTARMLVHARPSRGGQIPAMILVRGEHAGKVDTRAGGRGAAAYSAWHPSGKLLAFSRNSLLQIFHTAGVEVREVVDRDSDLGLYAVDTGKVYTVPQISRPDRLETWPAWSPDGRYLYFSSARQLSTDPKNPPPNWDTIRYDLDRVRFDPATGQWGEVETVVSAVQLGRSISESQISPDGKFLMFTGHDHGSFPIFQPSADLYLVDLSGAASLPATVRRLDEINSGRADSYHSWSSNSRWVIFSSKREDGMFTRLYLTHLEPGGRFGKPFVMPQQDPEFYGRCLMLFNRPELIAEPVTVSARELARAINSAGGGAPEAKLAEEPWQPMK